MNLRKQFTLRFFLLIVFTGFTMLLISSPVIKNYIALAAGSLFIDAPVPDQALNSSAVVVNGRSDVNSTVYVFVDNALDGITAAAEYGSWSFTTGPLAEGQHSVYAAITGTEGETIISDTVNFDIDLTPPQVNIAAPGENAYVNLPLIKGITEPLAQVTVVVYGRANTVTADLLGNWSFFDPGLPEGSHTVTVSAVDRAGNQGEALNRLFTLDITRPVTIPDLFSGDYMTTVPVDIAPYIWILEQSPIDPALLETAVSMTEYNSDTSQNNVPGAVSTFVYTDVYGENYYGLRFVPESPLSQSTRYVVEVNSFVYDAAGNFIIPRSWTFTTVGDVYSDNPHGNYIDNVNTCANCHAPHNAASPKLVQPLNSESSLDNYCNACHDGTVAPPVNNWSRPNIHNAQASMDGVSGTSSCASCHNPHLSWEPENPNLLQDYYRFEHNDPTNPYLPDSSEDKLCESCHTGAIKDDPQVSYVTYQYKNRNTATGVPDDYNLCLRCHDGGQAVNIAVYYSGPSGHLLTPLDAGPMTGYMPCADCHETHGSDNPKLLRNKLGHNYGLTFSAGGSWDSAAERRFCLSCHNGLTELYGITVGLNKEVLGHEDTNTTTCGQCHGGSSSAAAHAPVVRR